MKEKKVFLFVLCCFFISMSLPAIDFNFGLAKEFNWSVTISYYDESKKIRNVLTLYVDPNDYERGTTEIRVSARTSGDAEKKAIELWEKQKKRAHKLISANAIRLDT